MNDVQQLAKRRSQWITAIAGASMLLVVLLLILVAANQFVLAGISSLAGFVLLWFVTRLNKAPIVEKQTELKSIEAELNEHLFRTNEWDRSQRDVRQHLEKLRLPATPEALDALAAGLVSAQDAQRLYNLWAETYKRLEEAFQNAGHKLSSLLTNKLRQDITQVENALKAYYKACAERSRIAALANRKADLEMQLAVKIEAEAAAAEINQRVKSAELELRRIADLCGVAAESDEVRVLQLREWLSNREHVKVLQRELSQQLFKKEEWDQRQRGFQGQLQARGLVADVMALRRLADDLEQAYLAKAGYEPWSATLANLTEDYKLRADRLRRLLETKGIRSLEDLEEALQVYWKGCEARSHIAAEARRRQDLERQLAARLQAEAAAAEIHARRERARQDLRGTAERCCVPLEEDALLSERLKEWPTRTSQTIRVQREALKEWHEIDALLDGKTVEDLRARVQLHRRAALDLASDFSPDELRTALPNVARYEANVADLTKQVEAAALELANIRGQIQKYEERLTPVSEAEEELKIAEEELAKIRLLDDTLQATQMFLTQAQERVHRDIAPFLVQTVKRWLPEVTLERYVDARVDPETLQVRVCDRNGKWREAALLSHGTAEQIYLLLRLALVQYLTKPSEICPLILDDVTVQSDAKRKERILCTLKAISESRQVIFFTQEEEVLVWAKDNLTEPENRIVKLTSAVL